MAYSIQNAAQNRIASGKPTPLPKSPKIVEPIGSPGYQPPVPISQLQPITDGPTPISELRIIGDTPESGIKPLPMMPPGGPPGSPSQPLSPLPPMPPGGPPGSPGGPDIKPPYTGPPVDQLGPIIPESTKPPYTGPPVDQLGPILPEPAPIKRAAKRRINPPKRKPAPKARSKPKPKPKVSKPSTPIPGPIPSPISSIPMPHNLPPRRRARGGGSYRPV